MTLWTAIALVLAPSAYLAFVLAVARFLRIRSARREAPPARIRLVAATVPPAAGGRARR